MTTNIFLKKNKSALKRIEPDPVMEEYDLPIAWDNSDPENPVVTETMTCMMLKEAKTRRVDYEAYELGGKEYPSLPVVGKLDGVDIVHMVSDNADEIKNLKRDPAYLTDSYKRMASVSRQLHDAVHVTSYTRNVDGDPVRFRVKTEAFASVIGASQTTETIPHVYFGIEVP